MDLQHSKKVIEPFCHGRMGVNAIAKDRIWNLPVHCQSHQVNHFIGFQAEEMGSQNETALLIHNDFKKA